MRYFQGYPIKSWRDANSYFAIFHVRKNDEYLDFILTIDCTVQKAHKYQYSKLYYATHPDVQFHESRVICFQPVHTQQAEHIRIVLPNDALRTGFLSIRVDGLPYTTGKFVIADFMLTSGKEDPELSRLADLANHRQWVREQVLKSEAEHRVVLPHYPESISIELTSRCNLRCPHCSAHGTLELHDYHNRRHDISSKLLEQIALEVFPHITALSLVGRGEPTLASDQIWDQCMSAVKYYNVKISCVTNGHYIRQRFNMELIPYIDELCVSIDGNTPETHSVNRGGSALHKVLDNVSYFHEARQLLKLARRPKLSFYWTLMSNNIHELPDFIRSAAKFEPDYFAIRHLVVFHDKVHELSLLGQPRLANHYLKEAYEELRKQGIQYEAIPLMHEKDAGDRLPEVTARRITDE